MICLKCQTPNTADNAFCTVCGEPFQEPTGFKTERFDDFDVRSTPTIPSDKTDEKAGKVLDNKYRLESLLGEGGMGTVHLATRLHIGDKVAIKVLRENKMFDPTASERFRREVQLAARLKHPNVVGIYDFGFDESGLPYIVMELVEGKTLRDLISANGVLPLDMVADIVTQVCGALEQAHRQGLIHRDIKPDNIIVQETPDGLRVKVLDFGVAKLKEDTSNLTQTDAIVGTPRYMSPEQCSGEDLSGSSDIYSFGIVFFEMLCGVVPFDAPSSTAVAIQQVTHAPPLLTSLNKSIPESVERVVLHALEKKPEDRPASALALAEELFEAIRKQSSGPPAATVSSEAFASEPTVVAPRPADVPRVIVAEKPAPKVSANAATFTGADENGSGKKNWLLILIMMAVSLVLFAGLGVGALWLALSPSDENAGTVPTKSIDTNTSLQLDSNNTDTLQNGRVPTPEVNPSDLEFDKLSKLRSNMKSGEMDEIDSQLKRAESKYPDEYRFTYERARLYSTLPRHQRSFDALAEAAKKAIRNKQSAKMLDDLIKDKTTLFRRLSVGHHEWTSVENALRQGDESLIH